MQYLAKNKGIKLEHEGMGHASEIVPCLYNYSDIINHYGKCTSYILKDLSTYPKPVLKSQITNWELLGGLFLE